MSRRARANLLALVLWLFASLVAIGLAGDWPPAAVLVAVMGGVAYGIQAWQGRET